jgi:hypothetical protein
VVILSAWSIDIARSARAAAELPSVAHFDAVMPELRDELYATTARDLPLYRVQATFTPSDGQSNATIQGTTRLDYVNFTGDLQSEILLRLYPNLPVYREGALILEEALVSGEPVSPRYEQDDTLAFIPLPSALEPGERIDLRIGFTSIVPIDPDESYGMFQLERMDMTYNLAHWQPLLAGWSEESGWQTAPIDLRGDPVFTNAALFSVELTAPSDLVFATTGVMVDDVVSDESSTYWWESGPSRDFVMIASPDFHVLEAMAGDTAVRSFASPDREETSAAVLDMAVVSLEMFSEFFGPYPYLEFDVAEARIGPRAAGIEFPGLVYVSRNLYEEGNDYLEFTVVHEVAHQWWYALVGNNQYDHAFLDESVANYVSILYYEERYGVAAAEMYLHRFLTRNYFAALFGREGDQVVDQPTADFPSDRSYGRIVYGKGALGMHAIREEIGRDAFIAGLRDYTEQNRYGIATPADLLEAFERASGQDLSETWRLWFEAAEGDQVFTQEDIIEITR